MKEFKEFARVLAAESGEIIRSYFRTSFTVNSKSDFSPVTIADKKAEELMRELIMKHYPAHGIIGEEFGTYNDDAEYKWVLDLRLPSSDFIYLCSGSVLPAYADRERKQ